VNKQRMEKKFLDEGHKTSMTPSKLRALEEVGFTWAKRKGQPSWDKRFRELLQYKDEHGDCSVPTKYAANPALGRWVSTQRSQYKLYRSGAKTQMTEHRMRQLGAIGFRWNMTDREYEESRHLLAGASDDDDDGDGEEMEV
jgi:Helicase associated domain